MSPEAAAEPALRLGTAVAPSRRLPLEAVLEAALAAERLGYHSIWVPETWGEDAVSVLTVLARKTHRIRLAAGVFNVYSRSAALIAQTAATLQQISGGRFILGLGTSGPRVIEGWHGIPFDRPLARTREYVEVIRTALRGEQVNLEGSILRLEGFTLTNPTGAPVPIYLAALGPRNVRLAGQVADGWLPIFMSRRALPRLLADFRAAAEAAGRDADTLDVAAYLPCVIAPGGERLLAQQLAYYVGGMGSFYHDFLLRAGFESQVAAIRGAWRDGNRLAAVAAVDEELLLDCTLGAEAGTARGRLSEYRHRGVSLPILSFPRSVALTDMLATLEALAPAL